jgi:hypothetical protein
MSSSHLCPCPACNRHVLTDAGVCPFCQAALPATFCAAATPPAARGRMSRAARLLAGATLVGVSACSSTQTEPQPVPLYGAPIPVDASGAGGAAGSDGAGGAGGAADAGSAVPLYGAPAPANGNGGSG